MTREEAIKQLDTMWKMLTSAYDDIADSHVAAYTMAVDALKAQTDGDTISRQDAIDAILAVTGNSSVRELYEHVQEHGLSEMWSGGVSAAIDVIIAVPSAQPEEDCDTCKHGYFGDDQCNNCRVRYPSHYERRTDD